jgi:hypothetical protein
MSIYNVLDELEANNGAVLLINPVLEGDYQGMSTRVITPRKTIVVMAMAILVDMEDTAVDMEDIEEDMEEITRNRGCMKSVAICSPTDV